MKPTRTSTDEMTNRIVELAVTCESDAQFYRLALFDVAFASNPEEYKQLEGWVFFCFPQLTKTAMNIQLQM